MKEEPLILLVDDEEAFLEIAAAKLRAERFRTSVAHDFREALEKAEALRPDCILCDIYMPPGPSGWDLAFALRRNPRTARIKVAFFTSLRDPWAEFGMDRQAARTALGNIVFLSKTDDISSLGEGIARLIGT